jgi:hypothetical protein
MSKKNCWEVKRCGRQTGGNKVEELGVCPAAQETRVDGLHGGKNAGRVCWAVAGTFCEGKVQGNYSQKIGNCVNCDFYKQVRQEEGAKFMLLTHILKRMIEKGGE